jgi:hypothetical protein
LDFQNWKFCSSKVVFYWVLIRVLLAHRKFQKTVEQLTKIANNKTTKATPVTSTAATTTKCTLPTLKRYCHTHSTTLSYKANKVHSSTTCRKPGPNHKTTATETNKQGGSDQE